MHTAPVERTTGSETSRFALFATSSSAPPSYNPEFISLHSSHESEHLARGHGSSTDDDPPPAYSEVHLVCSVCALTQRDLMLNCQLFVSFFSS